MPYSLSPLRYPGGKSRVVKRLKNILPRKFKEYREAMVGGGSLFLELLENKYKIKVLINDKYEDLFYFWKFLRDKGEYIYYDIKYIYENYENGKALYDFLNRDNNWNEYERALRFFILNRITFSGTTESGGYSELSFKKRFTKNSIDKLKKVNKMIKNIEIKNKDYSEILNMPGKNVIIYVDPPYLRNKKSKLYGENGDLHKNFNHKRLVKELKKCKHKWLLTIDDTDYIRKSFKNKKKYDIFPLRVKYGMDNINGTKTKRGKEVIITNYLPYKLIPVAQKD